MIVPINAVTRACTNKPCITDIQRVHNACDFFKLKQEATYVLNIWENCENVVTYPVIIFCRSRELGVTSIVVTSIISIVNRGYFITATQFAVNRNSDLVVM